jgi:putative zinc finger protein
MKEMNNSPTCERASDLIAFVYNEASKEEARDFQLHLLECGSCREEVASFGVVRQSVGAWRDGALAGFVSTPVAAQSSRKSAIAALRQFFDLSPLWLKGATAFAAITLCALSGIALLRSDNKNITSSVAKPGAIYTEQDVNRIVNEALAKQQAQVKQEQAKQADSVVEVTTPKPRPRNAQSSSTQFAKSRRPLSRAERQQLAADLRLLSTSDDATFNLLGDRINQ